MKDSFLLCVGLSGGVEVGGVVFWVGVGNSGLVFVWGGGGVGGGWGVGGGFLGRGVVFLCFFVGGLGGFLGGGVGFGGAGSAGFWFFFFLGGGSSISPPMSFPVPQEMLRKSLGGPNRK